MKSVKTKIIVLVSSFTIASSLIIGFFSIVNSRKTVDSNSVEILNLLCENKANSINNLLITIEESVDTLTLYTQHQLNDVENFKNNPTQIKKYVNSLIDVATNAAENNLGAKTVYIRINPEISNSKEGFFYSRDTDKDDFLPLPPTDLNAYQKDNDERVIWYYKPIENKNATWISPYYNKNINTEIISYVIPYCIDNTLIGVVGMDIDFNFLKNVVSNTESYDSGYAFLVNNKAEIIYHKVIDRDTSLVDYNGGEFKNMSLAIQENEVSLNSLIEYSYEGIDKRATYRVLQNGMRFVLGVPANEINAQANSLLIQISSTMLIIVGIAIILTFIFTKKLVKPLVELTDASKKIVSGDLNVTIKHQSQDEVGILAESFRQTSVHLEKYFSYVNTLAYKDPLTGVKNKAAYIEDIKEIDDDIEEGTARFAVVVFDINGLKDTNDHQGHNSGDLLIKNCCDLICQSFHNFPVYRIGGDEFVVILQDVDNYQYPALLERFKKDSREFNDMNVQENVSVACGIAIYSSYIDKNFTDVFKRADRSMYENKLEMKKGGCNE